MTEETIVLEEKNVSWNVESLDGGKEGGQRCR